MNAALLTRYVPSVEQALERVFPREELPQARIFEACRYSLLAGGKRIRASLLLAFYEQCGGRTEEGMPFACALELIHAYSLVHDDLPCMDDDDLRRGRPTNHKVYGEGMAVLAGDGLLNRAFELMLAPGAVPPQRAMACASYLAAQSGVYGMIGGQTLDLSPELTADDSLLERMVDLKTSALLRAACVGGCLLAGADEALVHAAERYATAVGMAFQITDDLLDVLGDEQTLGKQVGHDAAQGKRTFVARYGVDGCRALVSRYTEQAEQAAARFPDPAPLCELARTLAARDR